MRRLIIANTYYQVIFAMQMRNTIFKRDDGCEMDYMTLKEAAEKWGVTPRRVNYYCAGERIPGAMKMAGVWLIPKNAEKPIDGRTKQGRLLKHE